MKKHLLISSFLTLIKFQKAYYAIGIAACILLTLPTAFSQEVEFDWVKVMGSDKTKSEELFTIALDRENNVLTAGMFYDTAKFAVVGQSTFELVSTGEHDIFISKQNSDGDFLWVSHIGGNNFEKTQSITSDDSGNVYVTGYFRDSLIVDPGNNPFAILISDGVIREDIFIVKLDRDGNFKWVKQLGGVENDQGFAIVSDGEGNLYVGGRFKGKSDFNLDQPGTAVLSSTGGDDAFIAKYNTDGDFIWVKHISSLTNNYTQALTLDGKGNLYAAGQCGSGIISFGGSTSITTPSNSMFISKMDTAGNFTWVKTISRPTVVSIAVDYQGNVLASGRFSGTVDFNPDDNVSNWFTVPGDADGFILKLDSLGDYLWAVQLSGQYDENQIYDVTTDRVGNVYSTGYFITEVDFDPGSSTNLIDAGDNNEDIFIWKLSPDADFIWVKHLASTGYGEGTALTLDGSGNIYSSGRYAGRMDFDPGVDSHHVSAYGTSVYTHKMICVDTSSETITAETCNNKPYVFNDVEYTESGTYKTVYSNIHGCDSTIILDLTVHHIDKPTINVDSLKLGVAQIYDQYQWLLNGEEIDGATDSILHVTKNGDYQVVVTDENGCLDTSDIYTIKNASRIKTPTSLQQIDMYPNPVKDILHFNVNEHISIVISSLDGRVLRQADNTRSIATEGLAEGMYIARIYTQSGVLIGVGKFIKQK